MRKSHKDDLEGKIAEISEMFSETEFYVYGRLHNLF